MRNKACIPTLYLYPAYGRTYASSEKMLAAWYAGQDFRGSGGYTSSFEVATLREMGYQEIRLSDASGMMTVGIPV